MRRVAIEDMFSSMSLGVAPCLVQGRGRQCLYSSQYKLCKVRYTTFPTSPHPNFPSLRATAADFLLIKTIKIIFIQIYIVSLDFLLSFRYYPTFVYEKPVAFCRFVRERWSAFLRKRSVRRLSRACKVLAWGIVRLRQDERSRGVRRDRPGLATQSRNGECNVADFSGLERIRRVS